MKRICSFILVFTMIATLFVGGPVGKITDISASSGYPYVVEKDSLTLYDGETVPSAGGQDETVSLSEKATQKSNSLEAGVSTPTVLDRNSQQEGMMNISTLKSAGQLQQTSEQSDASTDTAIVVDGKRDDGYLPYNSLDWREWYTYQGVSTFYDPIDYRRVQNKLYFDWDEEFVYLYFESVSKDALYQPAQGETRATANAAGTFFETVDIYLDTAPSLEFDGVCQSNSANVCGHFYCNACDGAGKYNRLQVRVAPAFGDWWNYYRSDEGMFLSYDKFVQARQGQAGYEDLEAMYLQENGESQAVSFIDYDTNTYGFELKYRRGEGEEFFRFNVVNTVKEHTWEDGAVESSYTLAFGEKWNTEVGSMYDVYFQDYVIDSAVPGVESLIRSLPETVVLADKADVEQAKAAYDALSKAAKLQVQEPLVEKLQNAVTVVEQLDIAAYPFTYTVNNGGVTITGYRAADSKVTVPSTIEGLPVVAIGEEAFADRTDITEVTIPQGVTVIGVRAFYNCQALTDISLSDTVTTIERLAFCGCVSLEEIQIPKGVVAIGEQVFHGCTTLTAIHVAADNSRFAEENGVLFDKDKTLLIQYPMGKTAQIYAIPQSVTQIGGYAFYDCIAITQITAPGSLTDIEAYAFYGCTALSVLALPQQMNTLGEGAFFNCISLSSFTVPHGIQAIEYATFGGCTGLKDVNLPRQGITVDEYAFYHCTGLEKILIPDSFTTIAESAFSDVSDTMTVYGYVDSAAQTMAVDHGFDFVDLQQMEPLVTVESAAAKTGTEFTVAVNVQNNSGIAAMTLSLGYDADVLELVGAKAVDFAGISFEIGDNGLVMRWKDAFGGNRITDGTLALITFKVDDDAQAATLPLTLSYNVEDIYDSQQNFVHFNTVSGTVRVFTYYPGDLDGNDTVDNKDLSLLQRYLTGWDVTVNTEAADVIRDGMLDNKDYCQLQRYVNDWDVELQ
ncbi:MAG: leucine-rich repeat protein [Clostridia bacterium]|nr:leucine-rich repeat protein [Clostridia bacterium]